MKGKFSARTLGAGFCLAATAALGLAAPAQAHDTVTGMTPAADSQLTEAPREVTLDFSGEIMDVEGANQVRVTSADGTDVTVGEPEVKGTTVTQQLSTDDAAEGTYTVTWRVVSSDGHPIQNSYSYTVGGSSSAGSTSASQESSAEVASSNETEESKSGFTVTNIAIFTVVAICLIGATIIVARKARNR